MPSEATGGILYKKSHHYSSLFVVTNGGDLLLVKLRALLLKYVEERLGTLQNFVECALRFLDSLVILITRCVLFGERAVDYLQSVCERLHLLLDLALLFLFLVDEILDLSALLVDALHHFHQFGIGVVQMPRSHLFEFKNHNSSKIAGKSCIG